MHYTNRSCLNCQEPTKSKFCSKSCCATYYNRLHPKRFMKKTCITCGTKIRSIHKYCVNCRPKKLAWNTDTLKISDFHNRAKYQVSAVIRALARRTYDANNKPKICYICGYDKHIEVCHIKAIASFNSDTLISVVNNIDNLIALCPTHHWELDNNMLDKPLH